MHMRYGKGVEAEAEADNAEEIGCSDDNTVAVSKGQIQSDIKNIDHISILSIICYTMCGHAECRVFVCMMSMSSMMTRLRPRHY
jgi:hypothetical protein